MRAYIHCVSKKYEAFLRCGKSKMVFIFLAFSFPYGGTANHAISDARGGTSTQADLTLFRIAEHAHFAQSVELAELVEQMLCFRENGNSKGSV